MKKPIIAIGIVLLAALAVYGYGYSQLQSPANRVIEKDSRNRGIEIHVRYENWFPSDSIVYDIRKISGSNSQADVFRVFLQFAESQKEQRFERVYLAHKGKRKFYLEGTFFRELGAEYGEQNPTYTMRTFPENVYELSGSKAFPTWEGGLIGVVTKQIEDFSEFNKKWYWNEI